MGEINAATKEGAVKPVASPWEEAQQRPKEEFEPGREIADAP